jgi:dethiobiotin synthetase
MKRYFITGTDTDCGKTYVTTQLLDYFSHSAAIKPVASGGSLVGEQLVNGDALQLQQKTNLSLDLINPWTFKRPLSPHLAAKKEGVQLSIQEIASYCTEVQLNNIDRLFIEGAGGLMVPLNDNETWVDFLQYTQIPVILVVGMTLGCLNHALLTQTAFNAYNIPCVGWIANCLDSQMQALDENIDTLDRLLHVPRLATVPYASALIAHSLLKYC